MIVSELIERLESAKCPGAEVFIAGYGESPEEATNILFADENNSDGELAFMDWGNAVGGKAVLILNEDV